MSGYTFNARDYLDARKAEQGRCELHPAYDADYCPLCGTAREIGSNR
jgi:hypothetical protein